MYPADVAELDAKITKAQANIERRRQLKRRRKQLQKKRDAGAERLERSTAGLDEKRSELEGLDKGVLAGLVADLKGTKTARIDALRGDIFTLTEERDGHQAALDELEAKLRKTKRALKKTAPATQTCDELLDKKEDLIRAAGGDGADELDDIGRDIKRVERQLELIGEAADAGEELSESFSLVVRQIKSAKDADTAGTVVGLIGGGLFKGIGSLAASSRMNKANSEFRESLGLVDEFAELLQLAAEELAVEVGARELIKLVTQVSYGRFGEWDVADIEEAHDLTAKALDALDDEGAALLAKLEDLEGERDELVLEWRP